MEPQLMQNPINPLLIFMFHSLFIYKQNQAEALVAAHI